mgnify:CR=1 FL=1
MFGYTVHGPLKVLYDQFMSAKPGGSDSKQSVLAYVSHFREWLHAACTFAKEALSSSQKRMKHHFDQKAVPRSLKPEDQVLVLLPIPGSSLSARFICTLLNGS